MVCPLCIAAAITANAPAIAAAAGGFAAAKLALNRGATGATSAARCERLMAAEQAGSSKAAVTKAVARQAVVARKELPLVSMVTVDAEDVRMVPPPSAYTPFMMLDD